MAAALVAPAVPAAATAIDAGGHAVPTDGAVTAAADAVPDILPAGLGCGLSRGVVGNGIVSAHDFAACLGVDWLVVEQHLLPEAVRPPLPFRGKTLHELARLLRHAPQRSGDFPDSNEAVEDAIINAFRLNVPDAKVPVDELAAPDPSQLPADAPPDTDQEASGAAAPAGSAAGQRAGPSPDALPEPFRSFVVLFNVAIGVTGNAKRFLQDNQWMLLCLLLAGVPVGVNHVWRRRRLAVLSHSRLSAGWGSAGRRGAGGTSAVAAPLALAAFSESEATQAAPAGERDPT